MAFDFILKAIKISRDDQVLDAGCGPCVHAIRLARRGFHIHAVDFSEYILDKARANIADAAVKDKITLGREDLTALSFPNGSFRCVWCWGVLMHVPEIERAIAELCRVTKPGGYIVISENNSNSLQAMAMAVKSKLGLRRSSRPLTFSRSPFGYEYWDRSEAGMHLIRHSHIRKMIAEFGKHNLEVRLHAAGQFTEYFLNLPPGRVRKAVHNWNNFWFRRVGIPCLSFGNILILKKKGD
jgi:ubiquinone/menaquinone biosynthesis C-methylase UbiE